MGIFVYRERVKIQLLESWNNLLNDLFHRVGTRVFVKPHSELLQVQFNNLSTALLSERAVVGVDVFEM